MSSCPGLAANVLDGVFHEPEITEALEHRLRINYIPSPGTGYLGIRKLLHDQKLHLPTMEVVHHEAAIRPLAAYGTAVDVLTDRLCAFADELGRRIPGKIYMPLTAGLGSRILAAAFRASDVPFEAVTFEYPGKPVSDIRIGRAISRRMRLRHTLYKMQPFDPAIAAAHQQLTAGSFLDWENTHLMPGNA